MAARNRPSALPIDSPERRRLPPLLRRAWYSLNQAFRRRIAHTGVTPDQFTALRTLLEGDPKGITQRAITRLMASDPNTIASLLDRMEHNGWIERRRHETDRRAQRIRLSAKGRRKYIEAREIAVQLQLEVLARLRPARREAFLEELRLVAEGCQNAAAASSTRQAAHLDVVGANRHSERGAVSRGAVRTTERSG
jgi:DNA-binding MarR family transcriptional regulator